jgi:DNA-binding transcriptional LysR family regulator
VNIGQLENLEIPHLETFSKAAELSSFTAAAKALRLTQAAVSQRVHVLEGTLGKPLFERKGGRVLLSVAGQKLYEYSQRIFDLHREARREVAGQEIPPVGELLLAASSIPGEHLLPSLLSEFGHEHPHIRVSATVTDSMAVISQVERGDVSLGIVGRKVANSHLEFRYFASDRMALIVRPGHELCKRKRVSAKQLSRHSIILRERGSGIRHCFESSLERAGFSLADFSVALELGSNEGIKEAVQRGVGAAILSTYAVQKELRARSLRSLEFKDLKCDREMFIVHDTRRAIPLPARLFLIFLQNHPVPSAAP